MQVFTLRQFLRQPSQVLSAAKKEGVIILSRTYGQFTINSTQIEIEITKTVKEVK